MMVVLEGCENDSMAPKLEKGEYNFTYGDKDQLEREPGSGTDSRIKHWELVNIKIKIYNLGVNTVLISILR